MTPYTPSHSITLHRHQLHVINEAIVNHLSSNVALIQALYAIEINDPQTQTAIHGVIGGFCMDNRSLSALSDAIDGFIIQLMPASYFDGGVSS